MLSHLLIEGILKVFFSSFAVATKHHLRGVYSFIYSQGYHPYCFTGEIGIFYEDLYDLVKPLHKVCPLYLGDSFAN